MSEPAENILILRLSALGDIIHTLPAVAALRSRYPEARMGWLVEEPYRDLVERVSPADVVFSAATRRWRKNLASGATRAEIRELVRQLRASGRGAMAIDFQGLMKSAAFGVLSGASRRFGFRGNAVREKATVLLNNRRIEVDTSGHVVEWNLDLARGAGADATVPPAIDLSPLIATPGDDLVATMDQRPVLMFPGAGHSSKRWGAERFAELASLLGQRGLPVCVIWGPGEKDLAEVVASRSAAVLAPPTNLRELAFVLSQGRLLIASDTGPLHMAAALGTPVVGLFGPTNPARNGPYGQLGNCVESYTSTGAMASITVDQVMARTLRMLS